jgi:hypothetical protein
MAAETAPDLDPLDAVIVGPLANWAKGKTLAELEVVVDDNVPCFADVIERYDFDSKKLVEHKVYFRVPPMTELAIAKAESLRALAKIAERDPKTFDMEAAARVFGTGHVEHRENLHVLARALRKRRDAREAYMTPENLELCHPVAALWTAMAKLAHFRTLQDMRITEEGVKDERTFWALVAAMAKRGNLSPLVAIDGPGQDSFLLSMAVRLIEFRTKPSSLQSAASST